MTRTLSRGNSDPAPPRREGLDHFYGHHLPIPSGQRKSYSTSVVTLRSADTTHKVACTSIGSAGDKSLLEGTDARHIVSEYVHIGKAYEPTHKDDARIPQTDWTAGARKGDALGSGLVRALFVLDHTPYRPYPAHKLTCDGYLGLVSTSVLITFCSS